MVTVVEVEPVKVALAAETATIENLGDRPLRFVLMEAVDEAAPENRRDGHLLGPGGRQAIERIRSRDPLGLWAWSDHPTRIGVGPRLDRRTP